MEGEPDHRLAGHFFNPKIFKFGLDVQQDESKSREVPAEQLRFNRYAPHLWAMQFSEGDLSRAHAVHYTACKVGDYYSKADLFEPAAPHACGEL